MDSTIKITLDDLKGKSIDDRFYIICDEVYARYIDYDNIESFKNPIKNLIYLCNMKGQIDNGGFGQFLYNATGDHFDETKRALKDIGMDVYLQVFLETEKFFPGGKVPKDAGLRWDILDIWVCDRMDEEKYNAIFYDNEQAFKQKVIEYFISFID
jgi:hypothetical protein